MAEYRAYTVGRDGHFIRVKALNCVDDAEAIDTAKPLVDERLKLVETSFSPTWAGRVSTACKL